MRPAVAVIAVLVLSSPSAAHAQSQEQCRAMARNTNDVLSPAVVNLRRVQDMGRTVAALKSDSSGELRASLERFDDARRNLAAALEEFIGASRELREKSEACSPARRGRG